MLGNVQQKISCVYETKVVEEPSTKRSYQPYKVVACDTMKEEALTCDVAGSVVTEKVDGTCVFIHEFESKPWIWARLDRKPNKAADRKFKRYQTQCRKWELDGKVEGQEPSPFAWNVLTDFKDVPPDWIPAFGVLQIDGTPQPDNNGHIPGWVPVDPTSKQHIWHLSSVDLHASLGLILQYTDNGVLEISLKPLQDYVGTTMELIGTNVNGNPYKIGSKQQPVHLLVRHGSIPFTVRPPLLFDELKQWFADSPDGSVEGIVWHCHNGALFKVHRHHFGLSWPIEKPRLGSLPIRIIVDTTKYELECSGQSSIMRLGNLHEVRFDTLSGIAFDP